MICTRCNRERASVRERKIDANCELTLRLASEARARGESAWFQPDIYMMPRSERLCAECCARIHQGDEAVDDQLAILREEET
jgi:hypothetical protein